MSKRGANERNAVGVSSTERDEREAPTEGSIARSSSPADAVSSPDTSRVRRFVEREAWKHSLFVRSDIPPSVKVVASRLADFLNLKNGRCDPSFDTLAAACALSRRAVINAIARLEQMGAVAKKRSRGRHSNSYQLNRAPGGAFGPMHKGAPLEEATGNAPTVHLDGSQQCSGMHPNNEENIYNPLNPQAPHSWVTDVFGDICLRWRGPFDRARARRVLERVLRSGRSDAATILEGVESYCFVMASREDREWQPLHLWLRQERWAGARHSSPEIANGSALVFVTKDSSQWVAWKRHRILTRGGGRCQKFPGHPESLAGTSPANGHPSRTKADQ